MKARARRASRSTSSRRGSTSARWCTSTAGARTASTTAPSSAPASRTSGSTASIPAASRLRSRPRTEPSHRYADGRVAPDGDLWIGVRERHEGERPRGGGDQRARRDPDRRLGRAEDHRRRPRLLLEPAHLAGRAPPRVPRVGSPVDAVGRLRALRRRPRARRDAGRPERVAGHDGEEAIWQPEWSPSTAISCSRATAAAGGTSSGSTARSAPSSRGRGRVRVSGLGLRHALVRVPRRRADRVLLRADGRTRFGDPRRATRASSSCSTWVRRALGLAVAGRGGHDRPARRGLGDGPEPGVRSLDVADGSTTRAADERSDARRHRVLLGSARDRVPDRRRPDRARARLPADEPRLRGGGRRGAAAHRDEPRRPDGERQRDRRPEDPVLDDAAASPSWT